MIFPGNRIIIDQVQIIPGHREIVGNDIPIF